MSYLILTITLLLSCVNPAFGSDIDYVLVNKSEQKMYLLSQGERVKEYGVVFGGNPKGHKQQEGDQRTPKTNKTPTLNATKNSFLSNLSALPNQLRGELIQNACFVFLEMAVTERHS